MSPVTVASLLGQFRVAIVSLASFISFFLFSILSIGYDLFTDLDISLRVLETLTTAPLAALSFP